MFKLRDYQQNAVDAVMNHITKSTSPCLVEAAVGSGKSLLAAELARVILAKAPHKKILCFAPSKELVEQNAQKYNAIAPASIYCASAGKKCLENQVIFCSPLTVKGGLEQILTHEIASVILDECFTGDTLISTPSGDKEIHSMRCGDIVYNAIGTGIVKAVSIKQNYNIYIVRLSNGKEIRTTENHPFFTKYALVVV